MPAIPRRESELARPRARKGKTEQAVKHGVMREVEIPEPDPAWHTIAVRFWESLTTSGQADFYQNSDWAFAWSLCDDLSFYKKNEYRRSPEMLKAILGAMASLLVTEGDRRKVRVELAHPEFEEDDAVVLSIAEYKADLGLETEGA